jgi:ParB/RepB/Spo0J family partition protein
MANPRTPDPHPRPETISLVHPAQEARRVAAPVRVPLDDIDLADTRFQHRLAFSCSDLLPSLRESGQLTPVLLSGPRSPFVVVDGFRRITSLKELGSSDVLANVVESASEQALFARSFTENLRRRSLGPYDKANAVWQAIHRYRFDKLELASLLGLSVRQIDRYTRLIGFAPTLRQAIESGRLSMAHAVALHRAQVPDLERWIDEVAASRVSATELSARLRRPDRRRRYAPKLVRDAKGFRLSAIRFRRDLSDRDKRFIWDALEQALHLIAGADSRR